MGAIAEALLMEYSMASLLHSVFSNTGEVKSKQHAVVLETGIINDEDYQKFAEVFYKYGPGFVTESQWMEHFFKLPKEIQEQVRSELRAIVPGLKKIDTLTVPEGMYRMESSHYIDRDYLIREGFNFYTKIDEDDVKHKFEKFLADHEIEYLSDGSDYQIKCVDRDSIYKVGDAINRLNRIKHMVNDNIGEGITDKEDAATQFKRRRKYYQDTAGTVGRYNKQGAMTSKTGVRKHSDINNNPIYDHEEIDEAKSKKKEPSAPRNTAAVAHQKRGGAGSGVHSDQLKRKMPHRKRKGGDKEVRRAMRGEGADMNDLIRMKTLAGLYEDGLNDPMPDDQMATDELTTDLAVQPEQMPRDIPVGPSDGFDELSNKVYDPENIGVGNDMDMSPTLAPADTIGKPDASPSSSEAYNYITHEIGEVQALIGDLKMNEYKLVLNQLNALVQQVRTTGAQMVSEHKKKMPSFKAYLKG